MQPAKLILASTSKTRHAILQNAGIIHDILEPQINEDAEKFTLIGLTPNELAIALAERKAKSIVDNTAIIIGADQTLACDGFIYNKPANLNEARQQLRSLRGKTHTLHSALAAVQNGKTLWTICEDAHLMMRPFSDSFLENYLETCDMDILSSVGAYQMEGRGAQFFEHIQGDYFAVLGFPLLPCLAFLRQIKFIPT